MRPKTLNKKLKDLEQFKSRFELGEKRKALSNKISILLTSLIIAIAFFYSSYTIKSINKDYTSLPMVPQLVIIFNIIATISSIFFITFLVYMIKKMKKYKN